MNTIGYYDRELVLAAIQSCNIIHKMLKVYDGLKAIKSSTTMGPSLKDVAG